MCRGLPRNWLALLLGIFLEYFHLANTPFSMGAAMVLIFELKMGNASLYSENVSVTTKRKRSRLCLRVRGQGDVLTWSLRESWGFVPSSRRLDSVGPVCRRWGQ